MTLPKQLVAQDSRWMENDAPFGNVVVSTRARFARNLADHPFSPHARPTLLERVRETIRQAFEQHGTLRGFLRVELDDATAAERGYLKEARLISKEMEHGGAHRAVYVDSTLKRAVMVNEEDHLRIQVLEPGLQISTTQDALTHLDDEVAQVVDYAFSERFGYLTACPTNVGTGLRASVMMHLPALTMARPELDAMLQKLPPQGLTVRGFHGENSENLGDFYQISNEITLGRSVDEIVEQLADAVNTLMERELEARSLLHRRGGLGVQDTIWRSYGLLLYARKINTGEAMKHLSRVRLGIDEGWFPGLHHTTLNRIMVEIQPSHLVLKHQAPEDSDGRDGTRATFIREMLGGNSLPASSE